MSFPSYVTGALSDWKLSKRVYKLINIHTVYIYINKYVFIIFVSHGKTKSILWNFDTLLKLRPAIHEDWVF